MNPSNREEFEDWALKQDWYQEAQRKNLRTKDGQYWMPIMIGGWEVWQHFKEKECQQ
jgi:hypothetical protein